jgi:hypothetical protein
MEDSDPELYQPESIEAAFSALFKNMNITIKDEVLNDRRLLLEWLRNLNPDSALPF